MNRKVLLVAFAVLVAGTNVFLYTWVSKTKSQLASTANASFETPIVQLFFDDSGKMWTFTGDKLHVYDNGDLVNVFDSKDTSALPSFVTMFRMNNDRDILFGGTDAIGVYKNGIWSDIPFPDEYYFLTAFDIDSQGRIWAGFEDLFQTPEMAMFEVVNGEFAYRYVPGFLGNRIMDVEIDDNDQVWVATLNNGIFIFDGENWKTLSTTNSDLPSNRVDSIAFDKAGHAWLATDKGISRFDGERWANHAEEPLGIKTWDLASDVVVDGMDRVWVLYNNSGLRVWDGKQWGYIDLPARYLTVDRDGDAWLYNDSTAYKISPNAPKPISMFMARVQILITSGVPIYLSILLIGISAMILIKIEKSIKWSLIGFGVYLFWLVITVPFPLSIGSAGLNSVPYFFWLNPGTYGTIGSIIGGISGKYFAHNSDQRQDSWARNGLLIGVVASFCSMAHEIFSRMISGTMS